MNIIHLINLFRAYLIENKKVLLIYCLITFGIAILGFSTNSMQVIAILVPYFILYWVAGTFFQSTLKRNNNTHFFVLPVTALEKFIHAVAVILILGITLLTLEIAGAYIGAYILRPLYNMGEVVMQLDTHIYKLISLDALSSLSLFLFGSIYFVKNAFIKTWASISAISIGVVLYFIGLTLHIFGNLRTIDNLLIINNDSFLPLANYFYIFTILFAALFLSLTYLRLRETEV
jgi:hypothetical protein